MQGNTEYVVVSADVPAFRIIEVDIALQGFGGWRSEGVGQDATVPVEGIPDAVVPCGEHEVHGSAGDGTNRRDPCNLYHSGPGGSGPQKFAFGRPFRQLSGHVAEEIAQSRRARARAIPAIANSREVLVYALVHPRYLEALNYLGGRREDIFHFVPSRQR